MSSGESCKVLALFRKPSLDTASAGRMDARSWSMPRSSRIVLRYWATVSRRTVAVLRRGAQLCDLEVFGDPVRHRFAFLRTGLGRAFGRHRAGGDAVMDGFPTS